MNIDIFFRITGIALLGLVLLGLVAKIDSVDSRFERTKAIKFTSRCTGKTMRGELTSRHKAGMVVVAEGRLYVLLSSNGEPWGWKCSDLRGDTR